MDRTGIRTVDLNARKSDEYLDGYRAYQMWIIDQTQLRPVNPYQLGDEASNANAQLDWQDGWDDASFDV